MSTLVVLAMLCVAVCLGGYWWEVRTAKIKAEHWAKWKAWLEDSFARIPRPFAQTPERFKDYNLDERQIKFLYALAQAGQDGLTLWQIADLWGEPIRTPVDERRFFRDFSGALYFIYYDGGFGPLKGSEDKKFELNFYGEKYLFERKII